MVSEQRKRILKERKRLERIKENKKANQEYLKKVRALRTVMNSYDLEAYIFKTKKSKGKALTRLFRNEHKLTKAEKYRISYLYNKKFRKKAVHRHTINAYKYPHIDKEHKFKKSEKKYENLLKEEMYKAVKYNVKDYVLIGIAEYTNVQTYDVEIRYLLKEFHDYKEYMYSVADYLESLFSTYGFNNMYWVIYDAKRHKFIRVRDIKGYNG